MIIGVDFDNTIVCYDEVFHPIAVERGLVPASTPSSKTAVRDHLRQIGREDAWTELQGYAYGPGMRRAKPFPGALDFFKHCREMDIPVHVISHRTRYPFLGEKHDLHAAARDWLAAIGFHDAHGLGLPVDRVNFELTKADKLARIVAVGCTHFIDDLPEFLDEPGFPKAVRKMLFDPNHHRPLCRDATLADSWEAITRDLLTGAR